MKAGWSFHRAMCERCEAMQRVMEDDDFADRLGASGPKVVAARFDLQRNTAAVEDVYEDVVARVRRP